MEMRQGATASKAVAKPGRKTLAGVIGSVIGAAALFVMVPAEESGRKVAATITGDATTGYAVRVDHVLGPTYLRTYLDIVGVPTACDGITKGIKVGQTFTMAQCDALLERELIEHAEGVIACLPMLYGRDHQVAAAVSLAYNVGVGGFCKSTAARHFRVGRWREGCNAFAMWNKAGGRVVRGLVLRRQREMAECVKGLPA